MPDWTMKALPLEENASFFLRSGSESIVSHSECRLRLVFPAGRGGYYSVVHESIENQQKVRMSGGRGS